MLCAYCVDSYDTYSYTSAVFSVGLLVEATKTQNVLMIFSG